MFMCQTSCILLRGGWRWLGGICATAHVMVDFQPKLRYGNDVYSGSDTGDKKYIPVLSTIICLLYLYAIYMPRPPPG